MQTFHRPLILVGLALWLSSSVGSAQHVSVNTPPLHRVLGAPHAHCGHVIDLLVCNHFRKHAGHVPHLPDIVAPAPGDLELASVNMVADGDAEQGPIFQVCIRNCSQLVVEHFRISVVGVLGHIELDSPTATVSVPRLDAGQTANIEVQLPANVMAMGPAGQQPVPFETLVVAIDSYDELIESDELNNVAILKRLEIEPVVVEDPVPSPADVAPEKTVPGEGATPNFAPSDEATPSPLDEIDLDKLDLGNADEAAVRIN